MPELPEVETTRRGLEKHLLGARIAGVTVRRRDLRQPISAAFERTIADALFSGIRRRAKYLLLDLDNGRTVLAHLGMSGSLTLRSTGYRPQLHDHVLIALDNGYRLVFNDPRRFGMMESIATASAMAHPLLKHLGPEPFSKDFSSTYLAAQLQRRNGPIKSVIMDQKLVVGVGNIYASESLYLSGLHPNMPAKKAAKKARPLRTAIRQTLQAAIDSGGSTLRDYVGVQNDGGYFQHHFRVYGRDGEACFLCGTIIEIGTHAGRSTFWCPQCQPIRQKAQKH
jgi:formamidopyrimidine-DNA glycosylase